MFIFFFIKQSIFVYIILNLCLFNKSVFITKTKLAFEFLVFVWQIFVL